MTKAQLNEYLSTYKMLEEEARPKLISLQIKGVMDSLHRYETTLHRLAEQDCNYGLTEKEEKKETNIKKKVEAIAFQLGFEVKFNGDPRGGAIRLLIPSGKSNNLDGETWGIYW